MIGFIIGLFVGAGVGIGIMALVIVGTEEQDGKGK